MEVLLEGKLTMSKIPELLRQLANEIEATETKFEMEWLTETKIIDDKIADLAIRAHKSEDKLQKIGKILLED